MFIRTLLSLPLLFAPPAEDPAAAPAPTAATDAPAPELVGPEPAAEPPEYDDPVQAAMMPNQGGLTSDQVAARAVENSYAVKAREAQLKAAAAGLDQTMIQFLPQVKATASYTRLSKTNVAFGSGAIVGAANPGLIVAAPCDPALGVPPLAQCIYDQEGELVGAAETDFENPLNQYSLSASLAIPFSDYILSLAPARKGSQAQMRAAEYQRDAERVKVESDARIAYYNWLKAIAQVSVAEQSLENTRARYEDATAAFEAGLVSKSDVMRLEALVENTESMVEQSREFRDLAARQLAMTMGEDGAKTPSYAIGEDVFGPPPPPPKDALDQLIERAWSQRLELKALDATIESVDYGIRATRANYYPRLDGFAEVNYQNPNQRFFPLESKWRASWVAGVSLTWVMNQTIVTKAKVQEYEANEAELEAQRAALRRGIAMEVSAAYADSRRAAAAAAHQARAVEAAEEAYRVAVDLYRAGEATTTDVIEAESERVNTTLQGVNAHIDLRVADSKLRYATGDMKPSGTDRG